MAKKHKVRKYLRDIINDVKFVGAGFKPAPTRHITTISFYACLFAAFSFFYVLLSFFFFFFCRKASLTS